MVAFGIFLGYKMNDKTDGYLISKVEDPEVVSIGKIDEVLKYIGSKYVDETDQNFLEEVAIESILSELDPHSVYIKNEQLGSVSDNMNGSYHGLGLETIQIEDTVIVVRVLPESPAKKAGIKRFDKITAIDTIQITGKRGFTIDKIREMLKARKSAFKLEILRKGKNKFTVSIKADRIKVYNADIHAKIDETTGIIKVNQFSTDTYKEFMTSLDDLTKDGKLKNLMIDLRGNPGGYLPEATKILNQLIVEGDRVVVSTVGRNGNKREYKTNGKAFYDIPNIAVFVDEESASGAEIIAGSLQDWDRGVVIGRKTFGKGLVQEQFTLSDGSAIRLTTAKYYLPSGRNIQRSYKDLDEYEDSNFLRMKDSSLFVDKSVKLDSANAKFRSMAFGRYLSNNDGINPDIFIPLEGSVYDPEFLKFASMAYGFGVYLIANNRITPSKIPADATLLNMFKQYCAKNEPSLGAFPKDQKIQSDLIQRLKQEIVSLYTEDPKKIDYSNDDFVAAAINYFKNPDIARLIK